MMLAHRTLRGGAANLRTVQSSLSTTTASCTVQSTSSKNDAATETLHHHRSFSSRSSFDLPDPRSFMSYQNTLDYTDAQKWNPQLSKIVATIGPTSEQLPVMKDIVRSGMRVMRLNFSHATVEEVELRYAD